MRRLSIVMLTYFIGIGGPGLCQAQVGGNISYSQAGSKARAEQNERTKRTLTQNEFPPSRTSTFVEANVLMNVKADEYIAVFGVTQEGKTVGESSSKMDLTVRAFSEALKELGIIGDDVFIDFVAQNRIYGFEVKDTIAQEKLVGFEQKKSISIHYREKSLLDKILIAAARSEIFDLIKVDYVVKDADVIRDRLMEAAARVIDRKKSRYEKLLGIKVLPPCQVYADRPATYYPTGMYDSYAAYEAEEIGNASERQKYVTHTARKSRTFFFNGLDANGFDEVINPVVIEPVVQFTLYFKVKYQVEQVQPK